MFWKKKETVQKSPTKAEKLPGPKGIPEPIGRFLVTELKQNPDWVWQLKVVLRPKLDDGKDTFEFRIFDDAQTAGKKTVIKDYNSLDAHPELILYQGRFNKKSMRVQIEEKKAA